MTMNSADDLASTARFLQPSAVGKFPLKINVHLELPRELYRYCTDLNRDVEKTENSAVSFTSPSIQKPHLTLAMGYCADVRSYEEVLRRVGVFSEETETQRVSLGAPYLKEPRKNYLFIDINESEQIISIKSKLQKLMQGVMIPLDWDVAMEPPHITIAYLKQSSLRLEELLHRYSLPPGAQCSFVAIANCGPRGSCLGSLRSFPLR